jgi:hypothetical protein
MADSTIPGLAAIAAPLAASDLLSVRRGGQTRNEKAAITDLATALGAAGPAPLAGYGTVTSVGLTAPSWLTVGGTPVTGAGTLQITAAAAQTAAQVLATSGTAASIVNLRALSVQHLAGAGATSSAIGAVQLAGDLGGTAAAPTVVGVNGVALPVGVANGGSGLATLTAYAVLAGGTTGTGALQQVSGLGTSGQVLTSNGAAALPTWQAAAGGGLANPLAAGSLGNASLQLVAAGDGLWQPAAHTVGVQANSLEVLRAESVASAVNYLRLIAAATTTPVQIVAAGTDANIGIAIVPAGTGAIGLFGATSSFPGFKRRAGSAQAQVSDAAGSGRGTLWTGALGVGGTIDNYSANDAYIAQNANGSSNTCVIHVSAGNGYSWTSGSDASQAFDTVLSRKAAGSVSFDTAAKGNGLGRASQRTSTAANATTTEYPNDKDWGIHQNTTTGNIFLVHNNAGTIVSVQLS